jgi:hypothetical protein
MGFMDIGPTSKTDMKELLDAGRLVYLVFPSVVVRTQALRDIGGFREEFGPAADVDLWTRLAERGTVIALPERLFGFRVHDQAGSSRQFFEASHLARFAQACLAARQRGVAEPTLAEYRGRQKPALAQAMQYLHDTSRYNFRRAGAAWLDGKHLLSLGRLATAFAASPRAFMRKAIEQSGRWSR